MLATMDNMILSPSGWRGIFSKDGDEENTGEAVAPVYRSIAVAAAAVFSGYLKTAKPLVILGQDTRPTGKIIADLMIRSFLASGCRVRFIGIAAAPEIMAYARMSLTGGLTGGLVGNPDVLSNPGGFCYISASHNPIGHNGFKFGLEDGGVLEGTEANKLIELFKQYMAEPGLENRINTLLEKADENEVRRVYDESNAVKQDALKAYRDFIWQVITGEGPASLRVSLAMNGGLKTFPLGIAADFNGSARTVSIDEDLFSSAGLGFHKINGHPGEIAHAIIPEGDSLESCCRFVEELHKKDPSVLLGYMPDCDGDRGNLVLYDNNTGKVRGLDAQEVFALACLAELAHLVWTGELDYDENGICISRAAIAVNGPTSMRIDRIAAAFGVKVFRAEVGEANVVNLARQLRREGYILRILGEGSNGGNITHPASVRDPLATVFAIVKLFAIRNGGNCNAGLFEIWRNMAERRGIKTSGTFGPADIIASLPSFYTTSVSAPEAKLQVKTTDHSLLKNRYQKIFERDGNKKTVDLNKRWGINGWEARACIGTEELRNLSCFGDAQTGGLKIVFKTALSDNEIAFIWMRGSKTEPVFRIMADAEYHDLERELIAWQRSMIIEADAAIG
ncbi:MAG: phosphatidylglycerol lysyltransferase [Treponema sp.]|nr:phosphatidylglycerol lysyltransferase [Treponema sp.]